MTTREMQNSFELTVNKFDSDLIVESHIVFYWFNKEILELVKTRYSGVNSKGEAFEQSQKRTDDLRMLVTEEKIYPAPGVDGINKPNSVIAVLPTNYMFALSEEARIQFTDITGNYTINKRVGVTEATNDTYIKQVQDPYSEHVLHYEDAKPLRLFHSNYVEIITDSNYQIDYYYLRYIKLPLELSVDGPDCELPEHMHEEIVDKAVTRYLESIGSERYQSSKIEQNTNE